MSVIACMHALMKMKLSSVRTETKHIQEHLKDYRLQTSGRDLYEGTRVVLARVM